MAKRTGTKIRTSIYNKFRGVDFTTDPSLVDDNRSPYAINIVADEGGMPEKRPGYRVIKRLGSHIYGLFSAEFNGVEHLLAHSGTNLYRWYEDGTASTVLASGLPQSKSMAVYMNNKLWIFTGSVLYKYDGTSVTRADADPYVPITIIGRSPSGGGETYESVNYLTGKQEIRAMGDGTSTEYKLPYDSVDSVNKVVVNDAEMTSGWSYSSGKVIFSTAPGSPSVSGQDNVFITFTKTVSGYADRINKCTFATVWGINGSSDRIVCGGNPDYPNQDFISGYNDGTYFPDANYSVVGTSETKIMGYRRIGEQLAVIKEDNGQDSTIFYRSGYIDDDGNAAFTIRATIGGAGAVTPYGFGNIGSEQMFLTCNGVYAITTNSITAEKTVQNRSKRVDPKLVKEDLTGAFSLVYKDKYMIFIDDKVYGLDGTQDKTYGNKSAYEYLYECFYWENIPATSAMKVADDGDEELYFGTNDGKICKFNYDIDDMSRFCDEGDLTFVDPGSLIDDYYKLIYDGTYWRKEGETITLSAFGITLIDTVRNGDYIILSKTNNVYSANLYRAIEATWSTKSDDDGDPMVYKTLLKKGNAVTIKPYARSSAKILLRTDKDASGWLANQGDMDIFDWEDIDFERFSFYSNDAPSEIPFNRKVKNYKRLQIIVQNDVANEGFGVYGIVKHYVTGNFAKR